MERLVALVPGLATEMVLVDVQISAYALSADQIAAMGDRPQSPTTSSYAYDALDRRVHKRVGDRLRKYVMAGAQVVAEYVDGDHDRKYPYGPIWMSRWRW